MKKIFSTFAFVFIFSVSLFGQSNQEYKETLTKMFEVSGTEETYQAAIKQMFGMFKKQYSAVDSEIWTELEKEFKETSMGDLVELLVPVYEKHLDINDLNEIIKFYQTEAGKKFAGKTPLIMTESMQVGQKWGMKIGQDFAKKMEEKGY